MYMILDNEVETHHSRKRKANPFDKRNYIVMRGFKREGDARCSMQYFKSKADVTVLPDLTGVTVMVGHNFKYDLHCEMNVPGGREYLMDWFAKGGKIWDTQYAEYLLRAQVPSAQICALDDIVESYGGRKKIDGIKALWEAGVLTSDINPDLLEDYLIGTEEEGRNSGDIGNTELVYLGQRKEAESLGMLAMIERRMDGLLATTECEYNGLRVDPVVANRNMQALREEHAQVQERLATYVSFIPEEVGFSWTSNVHVSCLLFGGTIKYSKQDTYIDEKTGELARLKASERWPLFNGKAVNPASLAERGFTYDDEYAKWVHPKVSQDTYTSGQKKGRGKWKSVEVQGPLKVKYQDFFFKCPGITAPDKDWKTALTDGMGGPVYSTGADTIEVLGKRDVPFLKDFSRNAAIGKELGTYYIHTTKGKLVGMLTCLDPDTMLVHHSLHHVRTITSRLSSSDPNLQNLPRKDKSRVKEMFVSRFQNGEMVEIDYSQLEVVVQGLLSRDPNLVRDLNNKIDFHCKRVALKEGCTYAEALDWCKNENSPKYAEWKKKRTNAKNFSFQRAYGAGAQGISDSTGIPLEDVEALIVAEEKEYAGVVRYNARVAKEVAETAESFRDKERGWRAFRRGTYTAPTGTMYSFRTYDAPAYLKKKGIEDSFMPTELKNYPVQGTGGEIVQLVLGLIFRKFMATKNYGGKALLVNTVHDCYWFDTHPDVTEQVKNDVMPIIENVPLYLKHFFGIDCPVPFPAEAEHGPNMYDLHHFA